MGSISTEEIATDEAAALQPTALDFNRIPLNLLDRTSVLAALAIVTESICYGC